MAIEEKTAEALYTEYAGKVAGYVRSRISSAQDAEDICAGVFLKVTEHLREYDPAKASYSTWIYTITQNAVRDYLRRCASRPAMQTTEDLELVDQGAAVDANLLREDTLAHLAALLSTLPERERDILILRYYKEMTPMEVAQRLNISYANVRYLQSTALKKLRALSMKG